ncbi:MAG: chemotaxis protein CheW [Proteobacteria bacterium]|nr:chemotaxis protein CheW [Pseudomonadota bacterium]
MSTGQNLLVVFIVRGCKMALPVSDLKEIAENLEVIRDPSEGFVAGSVALRGRTYPLIDINKRLGLGESDFDSNKVFLLVDSLRDVCALPVDRVAGVSEAASEIYTVPGFAFKEPDAISSFMMQGEDIVSIMDIKALMKGIL